MTEEPCAVVLPPHGRITLLDYLASDIDVVRAARISFDRGAEELGDAEKGLIRFLVKNRHGTPFEHGYFRFLVEAPIFVFREWHRHRIGWSYNEMSGRYTKLEPKFYVPSELRQRIGKPGRYEYVGHPNPTPVRAIIDEHCRESWDRYEELLGAGLAPEQARAVLPVTTVSKMWASCNPRSLMNFLALRSHPTAQWEIRQYAEQMERWFAEIMPVTYYAWANGDREEIK